MNKIPIKNIKSCTVDGLILLWANDGCLKPMKEENRDMPLMHYVIHREKLLLKIFPCS